MSAHQRVELTEVDDVTVVLFKDRELFTLCVGFFGIGTAVVTSSAGFSLAIGAFIWLAEKDVFKYVTKHKEVPEVRGLPMCTVCRVLFVLIRRL